MQRPLSVMVLVLVGVVAVVVVLSWLVGSTASEDEAFDWDLAAIFGTAVGTTLLALATGALAFWTLQEVSATKELASLTRRDQQERERPILIQEHASVSGGEDGAVAVTLLNVGLGPALRVEVRASYIDPDYQPEIGQVTVPAIKPGESERSVLYVRFQSEPPGGIRGDGFRVSGTYLDRSRRNEYSIITDWRTPSSDPS